MSRIRTLIAGICLGFTNCLNGQNPTVPVSPTANAGDIPALRVTVSSVTESNNSRALRLIDLNLSISVEGLPASAVVKQITVTKAEDNLGNVLGPSTSIRDAGIAQAALLAAIFANVRGGGGVVSLRPPLSGRASLVASVREAKSLKYAEGTIDLFLPSENNGAVIRIPKVLSHAGRIENPDLAKHRIEFHFLPDRASYDEAKAQVGGFPAEEKPPDFPNAVGYFIRDPLRRLVVQFQEANGTVIRTNFAGFTRSRVADQSRTESLQLLAPLPADAQIVFILAIPEAIKTVPFRVENIALP